MFPEKKQFILVILTGTLFVMLFAFFIFLIVLNYVKRKRGFILEKQIRESQFRQEVLQAQLEMQEHTFRNISQEIHDNVGQILSLAKVNLNILVLSGQASPRLEDIREQVTTAINELRNLSVGCYADMLNYEGLHAAIEAQLKQIEKTGLFKTSYYSEIDDVEVDKNKTIFLYRMVQEVLNNILKHSGGNEISVRLLHEGEKIKIVLKDNGKGFAMNSRDFKPGIGLNSIRNRAEMIGAVAEIESRPGKGTIVQLICKPGAYD